jgi:hypothetical protein
MPSSKECRTTGDNAGATFPLHFSRLVRLERDVGEQLLPFSFGPGRSVNGHRLAIFVDRLHPRREDGWLVIDVIEPCDDG